MSSFLVFRSIDLARVKSALGSGEEKLCAKILKSIPEEAEGRGMKDGDDDVKEWKRGVAALLLGELGETMSEREPFGAAKIVKSGRGLSLAFTSVLQALAQESGEDSLQHSGVDLFWKKFLHQYVDRIVGTELNPHRKLFSRPLFGLESDDENALWGGLSRNEVAAFAAKLLEPGEAPDADEDLEAWYGELYDAVQAVKVGGLDLVTLYG
jgi:hypothetical protein